MDYLSSQARYKGKRVIETDCKDIIVETDRGERKEEESKEIRWNLNNKANWEEYRQSTQKIEKIIEVWGKISKSIQEKYDIWIRGDQINYSMFRGKEKEKWKVGQK